MLLDGFGLCQTWFTVRITERYSSLADGCEWIWSKDRQTPVSVRCQSAGVSGRLALSGGWMICRLAVVGCSDGHSTRFSKMIRINPSRSYNDFPPDLSRKMTDQ